MKHAATFPNEAYLSAYWESITQPGAIFELDGGGRVCIVSRGRRNTRYGPDYLDAVLILEGRIVIGSIELHCREVSWHAHRHHLDPRYASVVLHVVAERSGCIRLPLPTIVLDPMLPEVRHHSVEPEPDGLPSASLLASLAWKRLFRLVAECLTELERDSVTGGRLWMLRRACMILGKPNNVDVSRELADQLVSELSAGRMSLAGIARTVHSNRTLNGWKRGRWSPARTEGRLHAIARLTDGLFNGDLLYIVASACIGQDLEAGAGRLAEVLISIGQERCRTLVFDCFVPLALSIGIAQRAAIPIVRLMDCWRSAKSLSSNNILRAFEQRQLGGYRLQGAFWQAGGLEFQRRYGPRRGSDMACTRETNCGWSVRYDPSPSLCALTS